MATKKGLLIFVFLLVGIFSIFPRQNTIKATTGACPLSFSCIGGKCVAECATSAYPPIGKFTEASCNSLVGTNVVDNDSPSTNLQIDFWMEASLSGNEDLKYNRYLGAAWTTDDKNFSFNPQGIPTTFKDGSTTYNPKDDFFAGKPRSISAYAINVDSSGTRQDYDAKGNHLDTRLGVLTVNCSPNVVSTPIPPPPAIGCDYPSLRDCMPHCIGGTCDICAGTSSIYKCVPPPPSTPIPPPPSTPIPPPPAIGCDYPSLRDCMPHCIGGTCDICAGTSSIYKCVPPPPDPCPLRSQGDANCDGSVNKTDLDIFAGFVRGQGYSNSTYSVDFNNDGKVNLLDYEVWRNTVYK